MGADTKANTRANTRGGGALERGHGAPLEPLAQLGDALGGVSAAPIRVNAAELVEGQTAKGRGWCQWALTERQTLGQGRRTSARCGHGAPLEPLAQLGDAVGGVGAFAIPVEAAELVPRQAAKVGSGSVNGR